SPCVVSSARLLSVLTVGYLQYLSLSTSTGLSCGCMFVLTPWWIRDRFFLNDTAPTERVRMVGDAVAAVAAVDEETAEHACRLIDVDYEPLPALMSIEESLAHPEVRIHEYGDGPNVHKNVSLQFADVEAAFARADLVREDVFFFEGNTHLPMEQHAAVAAAGPDGKLTLWSSTQTPHYVHRLLA